MLQDKYGRTIDYMRIAVTDKCNLRCFYCMPEEGIQFLKKDKLLSYEEMLRIVRISADLGVSKIRLTGGEPFLRKDIMFFIRELRQIPGIKKIAVTTNGTLTLKYLDELLELGVRNFNLSIDSLDKDRFYEITRRDYFDTVWNCFEEMVKRGVDLKLNAVVMTGRNTDDIIPMVELSRERDISVRFIEEMPFNGTGTHYDQLEWNYVRILEHIRSHFGEVRKLQDPKNSTSLNYAIDGFKGSFGIIPAYSRSFCGTCNRIRLTSEGQLKTCLYDEGVFSLRDLLRAGASDEQIGAAIRDAVLHKFKDGFEAEQSRSLNPGIVESMTSIGG
jgi:cyclic pyranopterin phosphate synthase